MSDVYRIFGAEFSPYSVKTRSYLRYKQIPHEWIVRGPATQEEYQKYARLPLIPLVRLIGLPRDTSVGIAAFGLMPLLIVTMGVVCPRLPVNLVGVTVAVMGCAFGYAVASLLMGFGVSSIGYGMTIMGVVLVPGYIVLALVVFVVRARNSGHP